MFIEFFIISLLLCVAHDSLKIGRLRRFYLATAVAVFLASNRIEIIVHHAIPGLSPAVITISAWIGFFFLVQNYFKKRFTFAPRSEPVTD